MTHLRRGLLAAVLIFTMMGTVGDAYSTYPGSYESITVSTTSVGFTMITIRPLDGNGQAQYCAGRLEGAQIRYRYDGADPTTTEGELLEVGDRIVIESHFNIWAFRAIRTGGTSGVLKMTCSR